MIHLLDHQGNNVKSKTLQAHTVAVNQISIDHNGDFIASCSDDGKVFIYGLYSTENNHNMSMGRLVKSIAIDPNYYKSGSGRRFITGLTYQILIECSQEFILEILLKFNIKYLCKNYNKMYYTNIIRVNLKYYMFSLLNFIRG